MAEKKVLVLGGTGFIGQHVIDALLERGYTPYCFCRNGSESKILEKTYRGAQFTFGDLFDVESLKTEMKGCVAVIDLVGIIREIPSQGQTFQRLHVEAIKNILRAMKETGVNRLVFVSALGVRANAPTEYWRTKFAAEQLIQDSGVSFTIFRPSVVAAIDGGMVSFLAEQIRTAAFFPLMDGGKSLVQPVAVQDLSNAIAESVSRKQFFNQIVEALGPQRYAFNEFVSLVADSRRLNAKTVSIPSSIAKPLVSLLQHVPGFPMTREQLSMLLEDSVGDAQRFAQLSGFKSTSLETVLSR